MKRNENRVVAGLLLLASLVFSACGARSAETAWFVSDESCLHHDQCARNELCVAGECVVADADGAFATPPELLGGQSCRWDDECGALYCEDLVCVAPQDSERPPVSASEFRYYDGSCNEHSDCGQWYCVSGNCNAPGFIGPFGTASSAYDTAGTGEPCVGDSDCAEGEDCRHPGYCHAEIAASPMMFSELPWEPLDAGYFDSSCNYDIDCDGRICHDGWCVAAELAGLPVPARSSLEYYDGSCASDSDCGEWLCSNRWCRDPSRVGVYQGEPEDESQAARAYGLDVLDENGQASVDWVADDAALHGIDGYPQPAGHADPGKPGVAYAMGGFGYGGLGVLSGGGFATGSGIGTSGIGGTGSIGLSGMGSIGTTSSYCASNDDCPAGDACVYPGECRVGGGSELYTTADITFSGSPGSACVVDDDCGPMYCRQNVCTPVETIEATMPTRSEIHWNDGSCYTDDECGSWSCVGLWCRP